MYKNFFETGFKLLNLNVKFSANFSFGRYRVRTVSPGSSRVKMVSPDIYRVKTASPGGYRVKTVSWQRQG